MAEVWLARATGVKGFQKTIVIKTILPHLADDPEFLRMFIDEALLAAALNHPNIVQIFDLGQIGETYFIAMEHILGKTMRQVQRFLRKQRKVLPLWLVLRMAVSVCDALQFAHDKRGDDGKLLRIVHRDVTPENIMISFSGVTKVVDFGIAKASSVANVTRAGKIKGKLSYLAPEQIVRAGKAPVDRRSDIYATGVMLYELLTGVRPFRADNELDLLRKITKEDPASPSEVAHWVPSRLNDIVMKAISKDWKARYQHAAELGEDLEVFLTSLGAYPTERNIAGYMCKLFDEKERQLPVFESSDAPEPAVPRSLESGTGAEFDGPDSGGSISIEISVQEALTTSTPQFELPKPVGDNEPADTAAAPEPAKEPDTARVLRERPGAGTQRVVQAPVVKVPSGVAGIETEWESLSLSFPGEPETIEVPKASIELLQPSTERPKASIELLAPTTELPQPSIELPQPSIELPQPSIELPRPTVEVREGDEPERRNTKLDVRETQPSITAEQGAREIAASPPARSDGALGQGGRAGAAALFQGEPRGEPAAFGSLWDSLVERVRAESAPPEAAAPALDPKDTVVPESPPGPERVAASDKHAWDLVVERATAIAADDDLPGNVSGRVDRADTPAVPKAGRDAFGHSRPVGSWRKATDEQDLAALAFDEGLALIRQGDRESALAAWERAVALAPDNRRYQGNLRLLRKALEEKD
jgi:serine/threonine protein kinase